MADSTKIEIRDVEHVYQSDFSTVTALASVSFTVADGEFVALLGPTGRALMKKPPFCRFVTPGIWPHWGLRFGDATTAMARRLSGCSAAKAPSGGI